MSAIKCVTDNMVRAIHISVYINIKTNRPLFIIIIITSGATVLVRALATSPISGHYYFDKIPKENSLQTKPMVG
jgi:hypothetical protein